MPPRILVVDDEPGVRESLRMLLKAEFEVETAGDVNSALKIIDSAPPRLVLLDLLMPGRNGMELLGELQSRGLHIPVIVLTATKTVATAVEAMQRGASDFLTKPPELDALRIKVRQLLAHSELEEEVARLRDEIEERHRLGELIGRSPAMHEVFRAIERVATSRASVLISGESGTGKELVARAIQQLSPRHDGPYLAVNCGAIPHHLIESELFGHERGAFTDAVDQRIGRFEMASGGTLLLDEIGELEPAVQVKLLRVLQERCIERVGSSESIEIDVRILAATNRDLETEVEAGRFRPDLYYRINVVPIRLPPLRDRREDIKLLAESYLARAAAEAKRELQLAPTTLAALRAYAWPGNVRELENAIEHGLALCTDDTIEVTDLPESVVRGGLSESLREDWRSGRVDFAETVSRFEGELLREVLERANWNQTRAASELGITRRVLKLKMDRFALDPESKSQRGRPRGNSEPRNAPSRS
jgi:DNA-binding NtrC family response regulator